MTDAEAIERVERMWNNLCGVQNQQLRRDRAALERVLELAKKNAAT